MNSPARQPVLKVAVPVPLPGLFNYLRPGDGTHPPPGCRVAVRFGKRRLVGVVMGFAARSELPADRLQRVTRVLDGGRPSVSGELLALLGWCARYYKHPIGEVIFNALPPDLRRQNGIMPSPQVQYRLTDDGRARLAQPPGRATSQYAALEALRTGPVEAAALRSPIRRASAVLGTLLRKGWIEEEPYRSPPATLVPGPALTDEQRAVAEHMRKALDGFHCHLVDGITGSGKTELYLGLLSEVLAAGRQALVLVPEIGLTPQLVRRFKQRLGIEPVVSHSSLAAGERLRAWSAALRGEAKLLLGTRSALFLPLCDPGLIIMDEAHDASFKQQDGFRFSARDVAVKRAKALQVPIVLGSATPSLETLHNALAGRYAWHRLRQRATGASEPAWRVVDLRQQPTESGLSAPVVEAMGQALERGRQVLVFLNRRGYAPVLLCHACGWHAECPRCDANMTWHRAGGSLICHHCEASRPIPRFCPECSADALQGAGEGTEQLELCLSRKFPDVPLHRVDRDRMRRKGELDEVVDRVRAGDPCILVGTQMLAKGHHFPLVTLVVVVNLDQALYSADFRAMEKMGQTLVQVAGRAGRADHPGTVILQTHHPDHPSLQHLLRDGYESFARALLEERRLAGLPPFSYQALLRAEAVQRDRVLAFLQRAARAWPGAGKRVFGPFPAMMERRGGRIRWYLLIQDTQRKTLQSSLDRWLPTVRDLPESRRVRWTIDVDPQEF